MNGTEGRTGLRLRRRTPHRLRTAAVALVMLTGFALSLPAGAVELRRAQVAIDFPVPPLMDEATAPSVAGPIQRFVAIAVTAACDYALFEFTYPPAYVNAIGEEGMLPFAVSESVARHEASVRSLERGSRGGVSLVDMAFGARGAKSEGQARYLHIGNVIVEAAVLCLPGESPDAQFLRSLRTL